MKRILLMRILLVLITFSFSQFVKGQTTVNYVMQTGSFSTFFGDGGGFFNPDASRMGMYANFNGKQAVAWRTFKTAGDNTGSNRALQVGDVFIITVSCTRAFGQIGLSLNAAGTQGSNYANRINGSRLYMNTDNYGAWYVNRNGGATVLGAGYNPIQSTYKDYRFTVRITSSTTADVFLTVDGTDYRAFNLTMNGSAAIDAFSVYGSDMWDGDSNDDAFWKQTATVTNTSTVQLGYFLTSGTYTPGVISNGLDAASTSTVSVNNVLAGGDAGSFVILNQTNTYTGTTTVNANARLELQNAQALGSTSGLTVQNNGALSLYSPSGISYNTYSTTLNGSGVSGANGALRSTGGNNTWPGAITLNSSSRINADTSGAAGSLTLSGNIGLGANNLTVGTSGANVTISGVINGSGGVTKDGTGTLNLTNTNTYTGSTTVSAGTLVVQKGGHSASITTGAIAFTFSSTTQAAGTYDFLPGQLAGSTSRVLSSNLVASKSVSFDYVNGDVIICDLSTAPTGTTGTTVICPGTSTSLTVSGGIKGTGAVTQWYTGSCGGTLVGTGDTLNTGNLNSDTTYYVRYSGDCNTTTCATVTVTMKSLSTVPTGTTGTTVICPGTSTSLTVSGGIKGTGAVTQWYTGSCGGTLVGTGDTLNTGNLSSDTTYYVRYSGDCNTTTCATVTVTMKSLSTAPTGTTGTTVICPGTSTSLTVSGGIKGTGAVTQWYTGSCGGGLVGTGDTLNTGNLSSDTTYYVRYSGDCNTTTCATVTVTMKSLSTAPTGTTGTTVICPGTSTSLTVSGGIKGTGAVTQWYTGSCGGTLVGTGDTLNTGNLSSDTTYYVRYSGDCNTTTCATVTVTMATEINFNSIDDDCNGSLYNGHAPVVVDVTTPSGALATMGSTITSSTATNTSPYSGAQVTYKFKVTKTNAPTSVAFVNSNTTSFTFSSASNAAHSSTYDVQATAIVNGEEQPYNGNTTSYTTPAAPTLPNPPTQAGPPNVTCAYTLATISSYIYANNTTTYGANRYEFLIERMNGASVVQTLSVATTVPYFKLTNIAGIPATMQVTYGTTYRISVRYGYGATSFGSQIYTAYGTPCLVSTPTLPVASIVCGTSLASINAYVYASGNAPGASQFEFKVTRVSPQQPGELPIGATEETLIRNVPNFKLTMLSSLFVGLQKEYSVSVRYTVNAYGSSNVSPWSTLPSPCSLFTPNFPETQVIEAQCGVEGVPSATNENVYANAVAGATQYRFRLYNAVDAPYTSEAPYDHSVYSPNNYVKLNQFPGLQAGVDYSVTVVAQLYGEYPNIDLAKDCSITAPQSTPSGPAKAVVVSAFQATAYPNPFANNFMIAVKTGSQSAVSLKVYDMIGRLIEQRESTVSDLETATIGDRYPSGVYNLVVSQQDNVQTVRVVKR